MVKIENKTELDEVIRRVLYEQEEECCPHENHAESFLFKLKTRLKRFVSIVPYLFKVFIVFILISIASIILWNNFIRKDRHEITLKQKVQNTITIIKNERNIRR